MVPMVRLVDSCFRIALVVGGAELIWGQTGAGIAALAIGIISIVGGR